MSQLIAVDANALSQLLNALGGPEHLIRELQFTRSVSNENPINVLSQNLLDAVNASVQKKTSKTTVFTKSEMELIGIYTRMKGTMTTEDNPEEGIRYFTSLVDRVREERSILAIRNT